MFDTVYNEDCLIGMSKIPSKTVNLILCDLPYGTTQNKWDSVIDLSKLWSEYMRIIKDNGVVVLTAQGLFTAKLIMSNESWFKYKIVWIKSKSTNFLNAKKQPLRKHEDICVFYNQRPTYNPQMVQGESYDKGMRKDQDTGCYGKFRPAHIRSDGMRYPNDVICMEDSIDDNVYFKTAESEGVVYHPTQKPLALTKYLIETYSNPNDLILDNCMGAGTTAIAAIMTNRHYVGFEKDRRYYAITCKRISDTIKEPKLAM